MPKKRTHEEFLALLWVKNKDYRDGKFNVVGRYTCKENKILLKNKYGYLNVFAGNLLRQKNSPNIVSAVHPNEYIKNMFIEIHGFRYNYDLVSYSHAKKKVKISCQAHGVFEKTPNKHLSGEGCPKCKFNEILYINKTNIRGWSHTNWLSASNKSNNYRGFVFYIIRLFNKEEDFIKVGRTYTTIKNRCKHFPYSYEIIYLRGGSSKEIIDIENNYKSYLKSYKYLPEKDFGGKQECFLKSSLPTIREYTLKIKYDTLNNSNTLSKYHPNFSLNWEEDKCEWLQLHDNFTLKANW